MTFSLDYRVAAARAALTVGVLLCLIALTRALLLRTPPSPLPPAAAEAPVLPERGTIPEARLARAGGPFQLAATAVPRGAPVVASRQPNPLRLKGIIPLHTGGLAVVESDAHGSRLMRVGDEWSGWRLREVGAGRAVFADTATGKDIVINMRKTGT